MNAIERELKTARGFASCRADEDLLDEAQLELERLLRIEEAMMTIYILNEHRPQNADVPQTPTPSGFEEKEI